MKAKRDNYRQVLKVLLVVGLLRYIYCCGAPITILPEPLLLPSPDQKCKDIYLEESTNGNMFTIWGWVQFTQAGANNEIGLFSLTMENGVTPIKAIYKEGEVTMTALVSLSDTKNNVFIYTYIEREARYK